MPVFLIPSPGALVAHTQQVVSRPGIVQQTHTANEGESINFHDIPGLKNVSSTLMRNAFAASFAGKDQTWEDFHKCIKLELHGAGQMPDLSVFIHHDVLQYIFKSRFYENSDL